MMQANPFYLQRLIIQIKAGSGIPTERAKAEYRLVTIYHLTSHFHFRDGRVERGRIVAPRVGAWIETVWMILSETLTAKEGAKAMATVLSMPDACYPGCPYAYHYVMEALLKCGMRQEARSLLTSYWGGMVNKGADTFWEVYDPNNDELSPYGFFPINSYCHAWSCTPVYFINKYPEIFQR